ncbi:MAG: aspartate--tRNA ligase [Candidatus Magasanikbacteria bacterium]|nr:aspartate--tRNA ligase [Candidatus Magasanikbacteria bacterium]
MYRTHTCGQLRAKHVGKEVLLSGWVHKHRKMGGLIFLDLRDRFGITQIVIDSKDKKIADKAKKLKYEYVVKISGDVLMRDKKDVNKNLSTGKIEVKAKDLEILSESKTLPFEIFESGKNEEDEELRLKYRYLELRRKKLRDTIIFRSEVVRYIRQYMESNSFIDISTPILTVSSPEGARDYLVPSRLHPGKFYALPQAPQQYKQLLMVAGFDRYYQIAPCMRDEDARADRSPGEFYQMDCEVSFMDQDDFFKLMEPLFVELTEKVAGKKCMQKPFPRIPYKEAMDRFGSDRPDLRYDLELTDISKWAKKTKFNVFNKANCIKALVVDRGNDFTRKIIDNDLCDAAERQGAKGLAWLKYIDNEFEGGVSKFFTKNELDKLRKLLNIEDNSIIFFAADTWETACLSLGAVRAAIAEKRELPDQNVIAWSWIVDFPMYEKDEDSGKIDFSHNPFSMPQGGMKSLKTKNPLDILGFQYDIVANGLELSSGAVRNKDPEIMYKAFAIAGYTKKQVDDKFGHMINAFEFGAPPHCGLAPGIERLVMLLSSETNIRSVVAFPKNQKAEEPMMGSPAKVDSEQLKELGLRVINKKSKK